MTDNEIIKALECCVKDDEGKKGFCNENCPLFGEGYICADFLRSKTLDVIKRQQAEIERLNGRVEATEISKQKLLSCFKTAKSEAIKEFVKKFEKKIKDVKFTIGQTWEIQCALKQTLKEMTEVKNNE